MDNDNLPFKIVMQNVSENPNFFSELIFERKVK